MDLHWFSLIFIDFQWFSVKISLSLFPSASKDPWAKGRKHKKIDFFPTKNTFFLAQLWQKTSFRKKKSTSGTTLPPPPPVKLSRMAASIKFHQICSKNLKNTDWHPQTHPKSLYTHPHSLRCRFHVVSRWISLIFIDFQWIFVSGQLYQGGGKVVPRDNFTGGGGW